MMMMLYIALFFFLLPFLSYSKSNDDCDTQVCREENDDDGGINIEIRETEKQI